MNVVVKVKVEQNLKRSLTSTQIAGAMHLKHRGSTVQTALRSQKASV